MAGKPQVARSDASDEAAKPYHHGDLRAALIRAGLAILAEEGAQALTVRAAARRAGVSHNAPYRHFADKEALLAAIAQEGFEELAARVDQARDYGRLPAATQLEMSGWAYVQYAMTHPDHVRVMFGGLIPDLTHYPDLAAASARAFNILVEILRAGQASGVMRGGDPQQRAFAAWAMAHGLAQLVINHQTPPTVASPADLERFIRLCLRQYYEGLASPGG